MFYVLLFTLGIFAPPHQPVADELGVLLESIRQNIAIPDKCNELTNQAYTLAQKAMESAKAAKDENEKTQYNLLSKDAEALADFISAIGPCKGQLPDPQRFWKACELLQCKVEPYKADEVCPEIVKVTLGDYYAFVAINKATEMYFVEWEWSTSDARVHSGLFSVPEGRCLRLINHVSGSDAKDLTPGKMSCYTY